MKDIKGVAEIDLDQLRELVKSFSVSSDMNFGRRGVLPSRPIPTVGQIASAVAQLPPRSRETLARYMSGSKGVLTGAQRLLAHNVVLNMLLPRALERERQLVFDYLTDYQQAVARMAYGLDGPREWSVTQIASAFARGCPSRRAVKIVRRTLDHVQAKLGLRGIEVQHV